jgi:preprotein translocase subunit SecD
MGAAAVIGKKMERAKLLNAIQASVLAVLLVAVLTVGFYHAGVGAIIELLIGLFIVVRLFRVTSNKG